MPSITGAASGAVSGAGMGSMFGPVGTGVGALAGGLWGLFKGGNKKNNAPAVNPAASTSVYNPMTDPMSQQIDARGQTLWDDYIGGRQRDQDTYADIGRYGRNFADTGGFSPQDIQNIRARAVAPIRSIYSSANREVDRSKRLAGGMANYGASKAKMAREASYALSDATTNAEAGIADMVQRGKQFGVGALTSAYGMTPGQSSMYGNQALQYGQQGLQNRGIMNQYDLANRGLAFQQSQAPNGYDRTIERINAGIGLGKTIGDIWKGTRG